MCLCVFVIAFDTNNRPIFVINYSIKAERFNDVQDKKIG